MNLVLDHFESFGMYTSIMFRGILLFYYNLVGAYFLFVSIDENELYCDAGRRREVSIRLENEELWSIASCQGV